MTNSKELTIATARTLLRYLDQNVSVDADQELLQLYDELKPLLEEALRTEQKKRTPPGKVRSGLAD